MDELLKRLSEGWTGPLTITFWDLGLGMACALGCGFVIAETYRRSHRGVDYSRSFLQVVLLTTVLVAFVTLIVADNLARAFTLVGALAVVRFRTAVKEARDLAFIFWSVGVGMGSGCRFVGITVAFTSIIAAVIMLVTRAGYGVRDPEVKVLRVRLDSSADYEAALSECFGQFLAQWERLSVGLVRQGLLYELVYLIRFKPGTTEQEFVGKVREVAGDHPLTISHRDQKTAF